MVIPLTKETLRQIVRQLPKRRAPVVIPRPPASGPLITQERDYYRDLLTRIEYLQDLINRFVVRDLEDIFKAAKSERGDTLRTDGIVDTITKKFEDVLVAFENRYTKQTNKKVAEKQAENIRKASDLYGHRIIKKVIELDFIQTVPGVKAAAEAFVSTNVDLIESLDKSLLGGVKQQVLKTVSNGTRVEVLKKQIQQQYGTSKSKAALIARDQVNKFNGQLTKMRLQNLGIERYTWRTVQDERVRDSHEAVDGNVYTWDNPPPFGNPGEDYQCRCQAHPIIDINQQILAEED